jgi:hypothetical protein
METAEVSQKEKHALSTNFSGWPRLPAFSWKAQSSLIAGCAAKNYNAGAMRIAAGCLLVAVACVLLTQSSQEFHSRYGEPDIERFAARLGISLAVEYGSDHLACQVVIEPPQSLIHQEEQARLMSSDGSSQVLEEVAPVAMRGKESNAMIRVSGCNEARMTDYEKVFIMRTTHTCDASSLDQDVRIAITFKRDICPKPKTPFTVNRPYRPHV